MGDEIGTEADNTGECVDWEEGIGTGTSEPETIVMGVTVGTGTRDPEIDVIGVTVPLVLIKDDAEDAIEAMELKRDVGELRIIVALVFPKDIEGVIEAVEL